MKDRTTTGILAFIFGWWGIHRFYLNQPVLGVLYLFTFGICGIMPIVDAIIFLLMSPEHFDMKYNPRYKKEVVHVHVHQSSNATDKTISYENNSVNRERVKIPVTQPIVVKPKKVTAKMKNNPYKLEGIHKFKDYDFRGAKKSFLQALSVYESDVATHFNLGCCYSMEENVEKSLYHLSRAVELGFKDFERIKTHDALAFLRSEDEFLLFQQNNYSWHKSLTKNNDNSALDLDDEPTEILNLNTPIKEKVKITDNYQESMDANKSAKNLFDEFFVDDNESPSPRSTKSTDDHNNLSSDIVEKLKQLGNLRDKGILTEDEFNEQKKRLLS